MNIYEKLNNIQCSLIVAKENYNSFGGYNFRNLEDILTAIKPLLKENLLVIGLSDDVVLIGDRYYVKSTATLTDCETTESISVSSLAREEEVKKKYDCSQLTGSASSYARKYALNGLFAIDDNKDADTTNNKEKEPEKVTKERYCSKCKVVINEDQARFSLAEKGTLLCSSCMIDHFETIKNILNEQGIMIYYTACLDFLKKTMTPENETYFDFGKKTGKWEALIIKFLKSEISKIDADFAKAFHKNSKLKDYVDGLKALI